MCLSSTIKLAAFSFIITVDFLELSYHVDKNIMAEFACELSFEKILRLHLTVLICL